MTARLARLSSLGTRLVVAVLATATVAFTASVVLTVMRLNQGLERQSAELGRLSEAKLGMELDAAARLAGARLERLTADVERRLETIAQRADVTKVVASANVVSIWELLGRARKAADIDGILVVDTKLRVFGGDRDSLDILTINQALQASPIAAEIVPLLGANDRKRPHAFNRTMELTAQLALALGARSPASLAVIVVEPIFDDFGDVFAALVAHRALQPVEPTLVEFSELQGRGLLVMAGDRPISSAGIENPSVSLLPVPGSTLLRSADASFWARCSGVFTDWRICALAPAAELHALRDEMVRIGETEGRSLATWLIFFALVSLLSFAAITLLFSRRISKPLARITEAVRGVARGDWKSEVPGAERRDEVGDIARAVLVLQRSLQERDRLRSDVAQAESVKKRREELEAAIRRFDRIMRSVLLSVSDTVETMDETARDLARMSAVAEGEAAETAFVSKDTVSNVSTVRSATERLSSSISETVSRINQITETIRSGSTAAQSASAQADLLAATAKDVDAIARVMQDVSAQTSALALNATIQASRAGNAGHGFGNVVSEIKCLADRISEANDIVADRMTSIRGATNDTVASARMIAQKLDMALQQTRTVALAIECQDAVTREIAISMSAATNGTLNVSSSVERLKTTVEEAHGASMKVVTKATDMADEAHRLDATVKSFLQEVTT
jgi:methyl-accepting chemotaxis protein